MIAESTAEVADKIEPEMLEKWNKVKNSKSPYGFMSTISKQSGVPYYKVVKAFKDGLATKENMDKINVTISKM